MADNKELASVGIYVESGGYRAIEVEFEIDWDEHERMIGTYGLQFNADLPGWDKGVAPEAYIAAQRLVKAAEKMGKPVHTWVMFSPAVRRDPKRYESLQKAIGCGKSSVPDWKNDPVTQTRTVNYLPEAKVTQRVSRT